LRIGSIGRYAVFQLSEARMGAVGFGGIQIQFGGTAEHMETRFELVGDDHGFVIIVSDRGGLLVGEYQREWIVGCPVRRDKCETLGDTAKS